MHNHKPKNVFKSKQNYLMHQAINNYTSLKKDILQGNRNSDILYELNKEFNVQKLDKIIK